MLLTRTASQIARNTPMRSGAHVEGFTAGSDVSGTSLTRRHSSPQAGRHKRRAEPWCPAGSSLVGWATLQGSGRLCHMRSGATLETRCTCMRR